jgi:antitoxin CptB
MRSYEKLKWRCRRGVVELDILLLHYLENDYLQANDDEKTHFAEMLAWEDDELLRVLVGGKVPETQGFDALIDKIRRVLTAASPGGLCH